MKSISFLFLMGLAGSVFAQGNNPKGVVVGPASNVPAEVAVMLVNTGGMNSDSRQLVSDYARQFSVNDRPAPVKLGGAASGKQSDAITLGGSNSAIDSYVFGKTSSGSNGRPPGPNGAAPATQASNSPKLNLLYDPWPTLQYFANNAWFAAYDAYSNLNKVFAVYPTGCWPKSAAEAQNCMQLYEPQYKQKLRENAYVNAGYAKRNPDGSVTFVNDVAKSIATNSSWSQKVEAAVMKGWFEYLAANKQALATIQNFNAIYTYIFNFPYHELKEDRFKGKALITSQIHLLNPAFFILAVQNDALDNLYINDKQDPDPDLYDAVKKLPFLVIK